MPRRTSQNYEYDHIYVATDGMFSKIGVSNAPHLRKLRPIRYEDGTQLAAQPKIVQWWHRPNDARYIEARFRDWFIHRAVVGFEWFAIEAHLLIKMVEREIWYADEFPKDKTARCPIPLRDVWVGDRPLPKIPAGMKAFKERGGKPGRTPSLDDAGIEKALGLLNAGKLSKAAVARECGISPTTLNNYFEWAPRKKMWRRKAGK